MIDLTSNMVLKKWVALFDNLVTEDIKNIHALVTNIEKDYQI